MSTDLDPLFKRLHLANARRVWRDLVRRAELEEWSYEQLLTTLISEEVAHRRGTRLHRAVRSAQFPFLRTIEEFDFSYQSTLRLTTFGSLLSPDFITEGHSVILEGKPGRGKTHLAIAIAYRAMQNGFEALFVNCAELIDDLSCASRRGELRDALMRYLRPHVLVVDEVGYLAYGDDAANVLFHVVNERHIKKRAMVFTTNKKPKRWGPVLHDDDLAEAIVDRILDRGRLLRLDGPSLRTKHLAGDTSLDDDQDEPGDRRVSGTNTAEFPEPTPAAALLDGHDGGAVGQRADWLTPRRGLGSNVRVAVRIIDDERAHLPWSGGSDREKSVDRLAQRDRDHRVTVRETALLQLGRRVALQTRPECGRLHIADVAPNEIEEGSAARAEDEPAHDRASPQHRHEHDAVPGVAALAHTLLVVADRHPMTSGDAASAHPDRAVTAHGREHGTRLAVQQMPVDASEARHLEARSRQLLVPIGQHEPERGRFAFHALLIDVFLARHGRFRDAPQPLLDRSGASERGRSTTKADLQPAGAVSQPLRSGATHRRR